VITASKVGGILGLSPYQSRADVLRAAVRSRLGAEREFRGNALTQYGLDHELDAITDYERHRGVLTHGYQASFVHPDYPWLSATPDALVGDDGVLEVKCPPERARYTHVDQRPDYEAQIRVQLECTQRKWGDLVVWKQSTGAIPSRVEHDPLWLPSVLDVFVAFLEEVDWIVADPERSAPHLAPLVDQRTDEAWQLAATDYLDALVELTAAKRVVATARDAVLLLADGRPARGHGVSVTHSKRRGSIDHQAAVAALAPAADLESYRGEGKTVSTVRAVAFDKDK
jgi:putative phage-type endonuclease